MNQFKVFEASLLVFIALPNGTTTALVPTGGWLKGSGIKVDQENTIALTNCVEGSDGSIGREAVTLKSRTQPTMLKLARTTPY
ncbi:hypothetical protein [Synechococcus sp. M16CYN]|uniref:hypothetical protein n=1 Tax=Synechococcus sp. M16CYN TaxID=3103139 RepID=UPI00325530AD